MKLIFDAGIIFGLLIMIITRFFIQDSGFMVVIQYIGLGVAYFDLMGDILTETKENSNFTKILFGLFIGMLIYISVAMCGCLNLVGWLSDTRALDIVTLFTLLLSLPQQSYIKLLKEKEDENENSR